MGETEDFGKAIIRCKEITIGDPLRSIKIFLSIAYRITKFRSNSQIVFDSSCKVHLIHICSGLFIYLLIISFTICSHLEVLSLHHQHSSSATVSLLLKYKISIHIPLPYFKTDSSDVLGVFAYPLHHIIYHHVALSTPFSFLLCSVSFGSPSSESIFNYQ